MLDLTQRQQVKTRSLSDSGFRRISDTYHHTTPPHKAKQTEQETLTENKNKIKKPSENKAFKNPALFLFISSLPFDASLLLLPTAFFLSASSLPTNMNPHTLTYASDPASPNTTYVQADPSTFRAVVQKLTGATEDPSAQKLPLTLPARYTNPKPAAEVGPRRPAFKLHERRSHSTKKLELHFTTTTCGPQLVRPVIMSPVSPFEFLALGSPRTPVSPCEVEEKEEPAVIAEKGFYLHQPSTPRGSDHLHHHHNPPELLPLFPLHSPRDITQTQTSTSIS